MSAGAAEPSGSPPPPGGRGTATTVAAVFLLSGLAAFPLWLWVQGRTTAEDAASTGDVVVSSAQPVRSADRSRDGGRTLSATATPQQQWMFHLRSLLRAGDVAGLQAELDAAVATRPLDVLAAIVEFGDVEVAMKDCLRGDLKPWLHFQETAAEAARHLPWGDPQSIAALNAAVLYTPWSAYLAAQTGLHPPEEIYALAQQEHRLRWWYSTEEVPLPSYREWLQAEIHRDPRGMIPLLTGAAAKDGLLWSWYFQELAAADPGGNQVFSLAAELSPRAPDGALTKAMGEWVGANLTVENLARASAYAPLAALCEESIDDRSLVGSTLYGDPRQRAAFVQLLEQQPEAVRVKIVRNLDPPQDAPFSDVLALVKLKPSLAAQAEALENWALSDRSRGEGHPAWLDELPSPRLRQEMERRMKSWSW